MTEFEEIMRRHAKKYRKMQPTDAVKLAYQNEFGCGHMIPSPEKSLAYLKAELETVAKQPSQELYEPIGNGWVRVNLVSWQGSPELLNDLFVKSANGYKGYTKSFYAKLETIKKLAREGIFEFTENEFSEYLEKYKQAGCHAVSHSNAYREEYRPAYRIIKSELLEAEL